MGTPLWTDRLMDGWMDGQTWVKTLPSRRTTYAGGNKDRLGPRQNREKSLSERVVNTVGQSEISQKVLRCLWRKNIKSCVESGVDGQGAVAAHPN